ncbi:MAG TPA: hypothetical protein DCW90_03990 [Lachnospiraceae bacterium]|nr:hypothetical protein [Lachnospiraceae bacterium]
MVKILSAIKNEYSAAKVVSFYNIYIINKIIGGDNIKKLTKEKINKIMGIHRLSYIGENGMIYEDFRQIRLNHEYTPYIISSFGRIFNIYFGKSTVLNVKELSCNSNGTGYVKITLHYNNNHYNLWIHRIVAEAFLNKKEHQTDVNHMDGNKKHNYIWNLEWCTHQENVDHAERNHLTNHPFGEMCNNKYSEITVISICKLILKNKSPKYICDKYHMHKNTFSGILHKKKWKHVTMYYDFSNYKYLRKKETTRFNDYRKLEICNRKNS